MNSDDRREMEEYVTAKLDRLYHKIKKEFSSGVIAPSVEENVDQITLIERKIEFIAANAVREDGVAIDQLNEWNFSKWLNPEPTQPKKPMEPWEPTAKYDPDQKCEGLYRKEELISMKITPPKKAREFWVYRTRERGEWKLMASKKQIESSPLIDQIIHVKECVEPVEPQSGLDEPFVIESIKAINSLLVKNERRLQNIENFLDQIQEIKQRGKK